MEFWTEILFSPIVIIAALVIGTVEEVIKRLVHAKAGDKGLKGVFYVTLPAQSVVVGILLGFIPWLPAVDALVREGYELAARIETYALAGIVCKVGYDTLISTARRAIKTMPGAVDGSAVITPNVPHSGGSEGDGAPKS